MPSDKPVEITPPAGAPAGQMPAGQMPAGQMPGPQMPGPQMPGMPQEPVAPPSLKDIRAIEGAALEGAPWASKAIIWLVLLLVMLFVFWSMFSELDIRARGEGSVVPVASVQKVQHLEGGIVNEILIREGDLVEQGQVLFILSPKQALGDLTELEETSDSLRAETVRLEAEATGETPQYPPDLVESRPDIIQREEITYRERAQRLEVQLQILNDQRSQVLTQRKTYLQSIPNLEQSLKHLENEIVATKELIAVGAAAPLELNALEVNRGRLRNDLSSTKNNAAREEAALKELQSQIDERLSLFREEARTELGKKRLRLDALHGRLLAGTDRVERTVVTAPVRGLIKTIYISTIGGVVGPGNTVVEIVPVDDQLLVKARIKPSDIAWLRKGQSASVRISAFDYTIFGSLDGEVERISPDTLKDERTGMAYYEIYVRTNAAVLRGPQGLMEILPGMQATVDIMTGTRTVMEYLAKPVLRGLSRVMTER